MKVIVKVEGNKGTPWDNGVRVDLLGDCADLNNLIKELDVVKSMVNSDMNRHGLALKDVKVTVKLLEQQK